MELSKDAQAMATRIAKILLDTLAITDNPEVLNLIREIGKAIPEPHGE